MLEFLHDEDLALEELLFLLAEFAGGFVFDDGFEVDAFEGDEFVGGEGAGQADGGKGAFAEDFEGDVFVLELGEGGDCVEFGHYR